MKNSALLFVLLLLPLAGLTGQNMDSTVKKEKIPLRLFSFSDPHSPTKATIYSAVIPGLGQLYNRKYWKVPVVYATFGTATGFMLYQRSEMRILNDSFRAQYSRGITPSPYDIEDRDRARQYRDFAILAMSAIYVLQIVDATVDAHFYKLNIDQNLEARLSPSPSSAFRLTYRF